MKKLGTFILALLLTLPALAGTAKKSKTPETYSATEEGATGPTGAPQAKSKAGVAAPTAPSYDVIPEAQRQLIARRFKLVEALLLKYGRAYDYRGHTVRELENELARLDEVSAAKAPHPAAAPSADVDPGFPPPDFDIHDSDHGTAFVTPAS
jgi:hypothetical protein